MNKYLLLQKKIAVVIPCYRVSNTICKIVEDALNTFDDVYVIDDECPENSGMLVHHSISNTSRLTVIFNEENLGVGGSTIKGFIAAFNRGADIVFKIDGDGQMSLHDVEKFLNAFEDKNVGYVKGSRLQSISTVKGMPIIRLIGNSVLSLISKISSGYWSLLDPTNGFIAINRKTYNSIDINSIHKRFFFESDMLAHLYFNNTIVRDVSISSRYKNEKSNLIIRKEIFSFLKNHLKNLFRRLYYCYIIKDINSASLFLIFGIAFFIFGVSYGLINWIKYSKIGTYTDPGTVGVVIISILLGAQLLILFLLKDIDNDPNIK